MIGRFGVIARRAPARVSAQVTRTETSQADWQTGTLVDVSAVSLPNSLVLASEPAWDVQYEANDLPASATPAWTRYYADTATQTVSDGILHATTSGAGAYQYYERASGGITAGNTVIVETEVRIVSASGTIPHALTVGDGSDRLTIIFFTDRVRVTDSGGNHDYLVDMTVVHTIRGFKYGTSGWALYVDGTLQLSGSVFEASGQNALHFGNTSTGDNGEAYWSYVYYALNAPITYYEANVLPTAAVPVWAKTGSGTEEILSGELHLINATPTALYYSRASVVTGANVTAVEYRMRVVSHDAVTPIMAQINDGTNGIQVGFWTDKLRVTDTSDHDYAVDMTVTHVVRIVKNGSTGWTLYVDGTSVLTGAAFYATGVNSLYFGHLSGSSAGESYWDYVYYTLNGNFTYAASGTRTWPSLDLTSAGTATDSLISWAGSTPTNTTLTVETSVNGGAGWSAATSGNAIPGVNPGDSLSGVSLLVRATLATTDTAATPQLDNLTATVNGYS